MTTQESMQILREHHLRTGDPVTLKRAQAFKAWLRQASADQLDWHLTRARQNCWAWQQRAVALEQLRRQTIGRTH
jgi:hypothetical protein